MRRGKETLERLPYERFMQGFEFSGAFLPPLQHGKKVREISKPCKICSQGIPSNFFPSSQQTTTNTNAFNMKSVCGQNCCASR